jgi:hypothetical protein
MQNDIPLDHAASVLDENATEEELDEDMTYIFWEWEGEEE